ncbi:Nitric oxide synthase-interacting protein-like protein [Aphelenchoides bicaudatus]|nr:Nitric oxide synthase-interacting protein-like protein [Aphelenchoides bicaudatus]
MTRHSKNSTASSVYTNAERKKDSKTSGYGTINERLGADSIKPFDCCSLSLQPCKDPMITPDGYIFDKEAILSYIVEQKKEQKRLMKAYDKYIELEEYKKQMAENAGEEEKKRKFLALELTPAHIFRDGVQETNSLKRKLNDDFQDEPTTSKKNKPEEESISNMHGDRAKQWKSFWVPELTTTAEADKIEKPSGKILNPMNGKPIKFKDLMPVIFTPVDEEIAKTAQFQSMVDRYKCPVTGDILTNSGRAVYIRPSQRVVSWRCLEKIIKKDMIDPLTNAKLHETDIIELQRGGSGFAAANKLESKVVRPQLALN